MILVDSSIWIDHLRANDPDLAVLLNRSQVLAHRFVIGELALGNLRARHEILRLLGELPQAVMVTEAEVLHFIDANRLHGLGIGYIDAHLLASTRLSDDARLWTRDKRLHAVAVKLALASPAFTPA